MLRRFSEKLREVLGAYGAPPLVRWSAVQNLRAHCGMSDDEIIVAGSIKTYCVSFSAVLLGTPHAKVAIVGGFARWMRARCRRVNKHSVSLCQALFRMVGTIGYATMRMQFNSLRKHCAATNSSASQEPDTDEVFDQLKPVLDFILRGIRGSFESPMLTAPSKPTGSTDSKRRIGGKSGFLNRSFYGYRQTNADLVSIEWGSMSNSYLTSRMALPTDICDEDSGGKLGRFTVIPTTIPEYVAGSGAVFYDPEIKPVVTLDSTGFRESTSASYPDAMADWTSHVVATAISDVRSGRSRLARVTAVCEAGGKVRTVTSSSAAGAAVSTHWQQQVFGEMGKLPCFPSLTKSVTGLEVSQTLSSRSLEFQAGSSDFRAASDLLDPRLTMRILGHLTDGHPWREIIMDDNSDKDLEYPAVPALVDECYPYETLRGPTGELYGLVPARYRTRCQWKNRGRHPRIRVKIFDVVYTIHGDSLDALKTCGQLMGQATSFPLLSLVNLGCSLAAFRRGGDQRHWRDLISDVIINGDDRVASSTAAVESHFWNIAGPMGLRESVGKSHMHPKYACINSQDYTRSVGRTGEVTWTRVASPRIPLLYGIKKLAGIQFRPSEVITALFETVPLRSSKAFVALYLRKWSKRIQFECQERNLFLPVSLGGFGQVPPVSWRWGVTYIQRALASRLRQKQPYADFVFGPSRTANPFRDPVNSTPWDIVATMVEDPREDPSVFERRRFENRFNLKTIVQEAKRRTVTEAVCHQCRRSGRLGSRCPCGSRYYRCRQSQPVISKPACVYGCDMQWGDPDCVGSTPYRHVDHVLRTSPSVSVCGCNECPNVIQLDLETRELERQVPSEKEVMSFPPVRPNREVYPVRGDKIGRRFEDNREYRYTLLSRLAETGSVPLPL